MKLYKEHVILLCAIFVLIVFSGFYFFNKSTTNKHTVDSVSPKTLLSSETLDRTPLIRTNKLSTSSAL